MTEEEGIKFKGFGMEGEAHGKRLNALLLVALCALTGLGYQHHASSEESHKKQQETLQGLKAAIDENTYVLSLSQAERERLNIAMPEGLRRKLRGP